MHEKNFVGHIQLKQCRGELRETKRNITITKKIKLQKIFFFFKKTCLEAQTLIVLSSCCANPKYETKIHDFIFRYISNGW